MSKGFMRTYHSKLGMAFRIADILFIPISFYLAAWLNNYTWNLHFSFFSMCAIVLFDLIARSQGLYKSWRVTSIRKEARALIMAWMYVVLIVLLVAFLMKYPGIHLRRVFVTWFTLVQIMLIVWHILLRLLLREYRSKGKNYRTVVIAGAGWLGRKLARTILDAPWMGYRLEGFYDDNLEVGSKPVRELDSTIHGNLDDLIRDVRDKKIDLVYISLPMKYEERIRHILTGLSNTVTSVHLAPDFLMLDFLHARLVDMNGVPTISVYENPFDGATGWLKRFEDIAIGSCILAAVFPIMLAIAACIRLTSPGPVFFKQRRYGIKGDEIMVWKFRTMTVLEDGNVIRQAIKGDERVTRIGAFLRRTSLDELPQFINVLQGTMSIVGPRPHAAAHNEYYRDMIPGYMLRHKVKPGITGWAQVNGLRGETDTLQKMQKRVEYDLKYIKQWSFWFDIKIMVATVFKGFNSKNAY